MPPYGQIPARKTVFEIMRILSRFSQNFFETFLQAQVQLLTKRIAENILTIQKIEFSSL